MHRLILFCCALVLVVGCGKSKDSAKKGDGGTADGGSSSSRPAKKFSSEPAQLAYECLVVAWGPSVDIQGTPSEQPVTFRKAPAVALHVSAKVGGERKDWLIIVQSEGLRGRGLRHGQELRRKPQAGGQESRVSGDWRARRAVGERIGTEIIDCGAAVFWYFRAAPEEGPARPRVRSWRSHVHATIGSNAAWYCRAAA